MGFEKISIALQRRYPQRPLVAAQIVAMAQKALGRQARVISFNDGTLRLQVAEPLEAANLKLKSSQLISKINHQLGRELVERIVFKLG